MTRQKIQGCEAPSTLAASSSSRGMLLKNWRIKKTPKALNAQGIGAVRALLSRQENHRTALVGFDDFETADLLEPGVTVVTHDPDTFGSLATEVLFRRIEGDKSPTSEHIQKVKLIKRGSGEIPLARRVGLAAFE